MESAFQRTASSEEELVDWTQGTSRLKESAFQGLRLGELRLGNKISRLGNGFSRLIELRHKKPDCVSRG